MLLEYPAFILALKDVMSDSEIEKQQKKLASRWLKATAKEAKLWVMLTVGIGLLSGLLLILQMYLLSHIAYAAYVKSQSVNTLINYFVGIGIIVLVRAGLSWAKEVVSFQTSAKVRSSLRQNILAHINQLGPVSAGKLPTGQLASSVMEQVEGVHKFLVYYLPQMSIAVLIPIAILIFVFPVSIVSGIIFIICAPLIPLFMALVGMGAASIHQKHFQSLARMSTHFLDVIQGLITLKLFGKGKAQADKIFDVSDEYRQKTMSVLRIAFLSSAVLEVFAAASIALLAIYLGLGFINLGTDNTMWWTLSGVTLQGALFILLLAPEFFLPLRELGTHYHARAEAIGAAIEIKKVLDLKRDNADSFVQTLWQASPEIGLRFERVSVDYNRGVIKALSEISFEIKPGEKVAIVGPSGAGKTTLLNTLLGFVSPSSGHVYANTQDINKVAPSSWYAALSWLGQNPMLFKGSIKDNLLLAKPNATVSECEKALEFAQLSGMVSSLPYGLDTQVGEQNMGLSGGQAQRLALARIYLKDTPFLLLDEPTSSLDADHEENVLNALSQFWKNKTVLILTHRLTLLERMDRIIVLENGQIVQDGPLTALLADESGLMSQLFNAKGIL